MKTGGSGKILVDTSAWIAYLRKKEPHYSQVTALIKQDRVACCGLILAELMQGAKTEKELAGLRNFTQVFEFQQEPTGLWGAAGELSFRLRRSGKTPSLSDCYIAILAQYHNYSILTLDKHFKEITKDLKLDLH